MRAYYFWLVALCRNHDGLSTAYPACTQKHDREVFSALSAIFSSPWQLHDARPTSASSAQTVGVLTVVDIPFVLCQYCNIVLLTNDEVEIQVKLRNTGLDISYLNFLCNPMRRIWARRLIKLLIVIVCLIECLVIDVFFWKWYCSLYLFKNAVPAA